MFEVGNLTKHYGTLVAIEDVDFTVEEDEILGFLEPNAAGKTATMRILTALARSRGVSGASLAPWLKGGIISSMSGAGGTDY